MLSTISEKKIAMNLFIRHGRLAYDVNNELGRRFIFRSVAVETSGAMDKSTIQFFYTFRSTTCRAISGSARE